MASRRNSLNEDQIFGQLFDDEDEQSEVGSYGYGSECEYLSSLESEGEEDEVNQDVGLAERVRSSSPG